MDFVCFISDGVSEEGALPARRVSMASRIPVSDLAFIVVDSINEYISCYFCPRTLPLGCGFARYNDVMEILPPLDEWKRGVYLRTYIDIYLIIVIFCASVSEFGFECLGQVKGSRFLTSMDEWHHICRPRLFTYLAHRVCSKRYYTS